MCDISASAYASRAFRSYWLCRACREGRLDQRTVARQAPVCPCDVGAKTAQMDERAFRRHCWACTSANSKGLSAIPSVVIPLQLPFLNGCFRGCCSGPSPPSLLSSLQLATGLLLKLLPILVSSIVGAAVIPMGSEGFNNSFTGYFRCGVHLCMRAFEVVAAVAPVSQVCFLAFDCLLGCS